MRKSLNFDFNLPDLIDPVEIEKLNENFEIIDNNLLRKEEGKGYSSNDFTDELKDSISNNSFAINNLIADMSLSYDNIYSKLTITLYSNKTDQNFVIAIPDSIALYMAGFYYTNPENNIYKRQFGSGDQINVYPMFIGIKVINSNRVQMPSQNGDPIQFYNDDGSLRSSINTSSPITDNYAVNNMLNELKELENQGVIEIYNLDEIKEFEFNNKNYSLWGSKSQNINYTNCDFFIAYQYILFDNGSSSSRIIPVFSNPTIQYNTIIEVINEKSKLFTRDVTLPLTQVIKHTEYDAQNNKFIFTLLDDSVVELPIDSLVNSLVPSNRKIAGLSLDNDISKSELKELIDLSTLENKFSELTTDVEKIKLVESLPSSPENNTLYLVPET